MGDSPVSEAALDTTHLPEDIPCPGQIRQGIWIVNPFVFGISAVLIVGFVLMGIAMPERVGSAASWLQGAIARSFGWLYIGTVAGLLVFVIWLAFSRYGSIRLGPNDAKPEFSTFSWFAMLFSAGMGIGLLFWSVAEPITHLQRPPRAEAGSIEAARDAINIAFFHWGLHPWAIYTMVGLALAYFSFRRGLPLTIRSVFWPLLGEKIHGPIGNAIDTIAVVSTLFGVATSLGLGVMQVNRGLQVVMGVPFGIVPQVLLVAGITTIATISVVSGVHAGIRRLSELNVLLAIALCLFVAIAGPTVFLLNFFMQSVGFYIQRLPETTLWTATFLRESDWLGSWTIFYWGWWIAWSPFVGMFIARVSRGRTIREFVLGVLLVPTVVTFLWLSIFGGAAMAQELNGSGGIAEAMEGGVETALFELLSTFPLGVAASFLATLVVISFFVTSSDSGSLVIDIITSGGHPDPPIPQRLFWAILEGVVAATLLYAGARAGDPTGSLSALQTASITTGLPFCMVLILMAYSVLRGLQQETLIYRHPVFEPPPPVFPLTNLDEEGQPLPVHEQA